VLSFTGDQGLGKTIWIENLIPSHAKNVWNKDAVVIDTKNKDSLTKALSHWIAELGEVSATFRKSDIEALKGFLTEKKDIIRNPYERKANEYRRRTVFYATVNDVEFLQDSENRRFWVLDVVKLHHGMIDDVGQFWAQMKAIYMSIKDKLVDAKTREQHQEWGWFMSPKERKIMTPLQEKHKSVDPVTETLEKYISKPSNSTDGEWMTCTDILISTSWGRPNRRDTGVASKWLQQNGFVRQSDTKKYYVKKIDMLETNNVIGLKDKIEQLKVKKGGLFN
jgi:putative DNA primase/helicase